MRKTLKVLIAIGVVVGLGTVAFAVAATGHGPRATDVPVMVTSRPVTSVVPVAAASLRATEPASVIASNPPAAHSKSMANSGKNTTSTKRTSTPPAAKVDRSSTPPSDVPVEVVRPKVHDETSGGSSEHHGDTQSNPTGGGD